MIKVFPRNILRFILLVLIQIGIFNNINLGGYINPYVYILFIILLPFETPKWMLLFLAFLLGLSIDIFMNTLGMHAAATVFLAYLRPHILQIISPREGYEIGTYPRLYYYGLVWFMKYSVILVFAHHFFLFFLDVFRFSDIFYTLIRIFLSSIFSIAIIVLTQFVIYRKG